MIRDIFPTVYILFNSYLSVFIEIIIFTVLNFYFFG